MHDLIGQAQELIRNIRKSKSYQQALDSAKAILKLRGYQQSEELQDCYVQALLACWERLKKPVPILSFSKLPQWKKSPSFQLELAQALTQATEWCRDAEGVFRLTDPITQFSIYDSPSAVGVQVRRLYAESLAGSVHLAAKLETAVAFANRIARLCDYAATEHLQVQAANCLLKAATFADTEDRVQQISDFIGRMALFSQSPSLATLQSQVVEYAGADVGPAQEDMAKLLLTKVHECEDLGEAYHFAKAIRELGYYEGSSVIQNAYTQALIRCASVQHGRFVKFDDVLAGFYCAADFSTNPHLQMAYLEIWRRFCSDSTHKDRPIALLQDFIENSNLTPCPEVEMSLATVIDKTVNFFDKATLLEWLERLSSFSHFHSDGEQGVEFREIFSEILTYACWSTETAQEAATLAERLEDLPDFPSSEAIQINAATCWKIATRFAETPEQAASYAERSAQLPLAHIRRPLGPRKRKPGDCPYWRVTLSQSSFEASICLLPYFAYNPDEFAEIDFAAKSAVYKFDERDYESADLKGLDELAISQSSYDSGCGETSFCYTLEFRSEGALILRLEEEETFGEWDRALPFLYSSVESTAERLAQNLRVPLIRRSC